MPIGEKKLELLEVLEKTFDDFIGNEYRFACGEKCSACCTNVVTATTLEAWRMLKALREAGRGDLLEKVKTMDVGGLFRPKVTTNAMAMACLTRREPPVEEPPAQPDACPLLLDDLCPSYEARPFACRGMFAAAKCAPGAEADMPPELVTIVTICWQIVEHLDAGGLYGNLIDLMRVLMDGNNAFTYDTGGQLLERGLPPTRPVPGFLVPPDQGETIQRFLDRLFAADCNGRTFRERMGEVRESPF